MTRKVMMNSWHPATSHTVRDRIKVGDTITVKDSDNDWEKSWEAVVDHFNTIGQPYVHPVGTRSPKYLFHELVLI